MPKLKAQIQDQSFHQAQPKVYRKYAPKTKKKLWKLVYDQGKPTNSAAKLLKIKSSTAKMMIKKISMEKQKEVTKNSQAIQSKQKIQIEAEPKKQNQEEVEKSTNNMLNQQLQYWVLFPVMCYVFSPQS